MVVLGVEPYFRAALVECMAFHFGSLKIGLFLQANVLYLKLPLMETWGK